MQLTVARWVDGTGLDSWKRKLDKFVAHQPYWLDETPMLRKTMGAIVKVSHSVTCGVILWFVHWWESKVLPVSEYNSWRAITGENCSIQALLVGLPGSIKLANRGGQLALSSGLDGLSLSLHSYWVEIICQLSTELLCAAKMRNCFLLAVCINRESACNYPKIVLLAFIDYYLKK